MAVFSPAVYPVANRFVSLGKETAPGSIAAATVTIPLTQFKPTDKYTRLPDESWRNSMSELYALIDGVRQEEVSCAGPLYADSIGYPLLNTFGDYWQGISAGTVGAATQLASSSVIGAGTVVVASASSITTGDIISIGGTASTACEVRKVTNVTGSSPGTLTLNANLYQAHGSATTSGTVQYWSGYGGIEHNFAQLNNGLGGGGWTASQPPTYTWYDFEGVPATSGTRQYGYTQFSEMSITSEATKLVMWEGKMEALASTIAAAEPTVDLSGVLPQAAWRSTVTIAGSGTLNTAEWKATFTRKQEAFFANAGQQDFIALPRGPLGAAFSFDFAPASDEQEFIDYLSNSQPTLQLVASNGLSGTAAATLTITAQQMGFESGEISDSKVVFGYTNAGKLIANTTNVGPSGGFGPCVVQLINQVVSY